MALDIQMLDLLGDDGKLSAKMKDLAERQARADRTLEQATEQNRQAEDRRAQAAKMLAQAESKLAEANVARERANETERRAAEAHAELSGKRADIDHHYAASAETITAMRRAHENEVAIDREVISGERGSHERAIREAHAQLSDRGAEIKRQEVTAAAARDQFVQEMTKLGQERATLERDRAEHTARIEQLRKLLP